MLRSYRISYPVRAGFPCLQCAKIKTFYFSARALPNNPQSSRTFSAFLRFLHASLLKVAKKACFAFWHTYKMMFRVDQQRGSRPQPVET